MARHTRLRPVGPQSAANERRAGKHHEYDDGRKYHVASEDTRPLHVNTEKPAEQRSPSKTSRRHPPTVSVAGVFKRTHRDTRHDKKGRRLKEKTPELVAALEDGLEDARGAISEKTNVTFETVHAGFNQRIKALEQNDKEFFEKVLHQTSLLSAPLGEEKLETRARRNGQHTVEIVEIGQRVAAFKAVINKEEEKLKDLWSQWDELQEDYIKLGVEVFGSQKFGESAASYQNLPGGYRNDMEHWKLEHNTALEEIDDEIEGIGIKILHKVKTTEKQLDAAAKKEQARLLQSIME